MKRSGLLGLGALAIALVGCGDDDDDDAVRPAAVSDSTPAATPTEAATDTPPPTPTGQPSAMRVRMAVPQRNNLQFIAFWVAEGAGLFSEQGVESQIVVPPMPQATGQFALVMGQADIAALQPPIYYGLLAQDQPVVVFANLLANDPINLVMRPEAVAQHALDPDAPLAERIAGLQGLRIGQAPAVLRLEVMLRSAGFGAGHVEAVAVNGENQNKAFAAGDVDGIYAHTPYLEEALLDQDAVMFVNQSAGEIEELTGLAIHSILTTRAYAEANPEIIEAVRNAIGAAQRMMREDPEAATSAVMTAVDGLDPERVAAIVGIYAAAMPSTPEVTAEAIQKTRPLFPGPMLDTSIDNLSRFVLT